MLFLCMGNVARSILGEAIPNRIGAGRFVAYSAGSRPKGEVNPYALTLLQRLGFATEGLRSKSWNEFAQPTISLSTTARPTVFTARPPGGEVWVPSILNLLAMHCGLAISCGCFPLLTRAGMPRQRVGTQRQRREWNQHDDLQDWRQPSCAVAKVVDQGDLQRNDDRRGSADEPTIEHLWM